MNRFYIFLIRAVLGAALALILMRFFYPAANPVFVAGLGIFMVGMAYVTEYFRNRKPKN
ncbi:MAG: hypothetical protein P1P89_20540 [Desulfobacterales bacterium]|nr:hypothetical protein [Desulfobacterales bacterium]